ncbi:uncharacterized protein LOC135685922 [Rhopilema esculentum]|uniref:uncharacterized protein LOC135685922 n=1 Tax=Rhopilema esculentum TaxID=499914 RepID=UPI0031E3CC85
MALEFFGGLSQTIVGGIGTAITFGLNDDVIKWTKKGAAKVVDYADIAWGKDGQITKFAESLPVIGYVASAGHGIAAAVTGDKRNLQRARRACASSTNSTLVTAAAVGGTLLGGPAGTVGVVAGAFSGGVLGSAAGHCAERGINHANDYAFQTSVGTFKDFNAGSFMAEVCIDGTLSALSSGVSQTIAKQAARAAVGPSLKACGGGGAKRFVTKRCVEAAVRQPIMSIADKGANKAREMATARTICATSRHRDTRSQNSLHLQKQSF